jgi:transposase
MSSKQSKTGVLRKKYTMQFKEQALILADKVGVPKAAQDLAIAEAMLYSWRAKRRQTGQPFEDQKLQQAEMSRLKREVEQLKQENDFLKKAAAYFAKQPK